LLAFVLVVGFALNTLPVKLAHASAFQSFLVNVTVSTWQSDLSEPSSESVQYAVRQDGSWVLIFADPPNSRNTRRHITDFQTGLHVTVTSEVQAITTRRLSTNHKRYGPATDCSETFRGQVISRGTPAGQILGFDVDMTEMKDDHIPPGAWGPGPHRSDFKTWMAPALGCFVLRKEMLTDKQLSSGWVKDWNQVEQALAVQFIPVEQYFIVPPSYAETARGDLMVKLHESSPSLHPLPDAAKIEKFNAEYYADRP
jgi:hypothetical protein